MAFEKSVELEVFGEKITFSNAYHKIESVRGDKDNLLIDVIAYKDNAKSVALHTKQFSFTPSQDDISLRWDKQGYEFLKTLDEYAGAIDV